MRAAIAWRQFAAEELDDDVGNVGSRECAVLAAPVAHGDVLHGLRFGRRIDFRTDAAKTRQVIHPQRDRDPVLVAQLARQAPADADVAVVVDDLAEDGQRWRGSILEHGGEAGLLGLGGRGRHSTVIRKNIPEHSAMREETHSFLARVCVIAMTKNEVNLGRQHVQTSPSTPGRTPTCREGGIDGSHSCPSPAPSALPWRGLCKHGRLQRARCLHPPATRPTTWRS